MQPTTALPLASSTAPFHSPEPWTLQACQADQGESSVLCDANSMVICRIPSAVWDRESDAQHSEDGANVRLLLAAPHMLRALQKAEKALEIMADAHEQETEVFEAGGWATEALRVVRSAVHATQPARAVEGASTSSFRVKAEVLLVAKEISAYDTEAAQRYARESLEEVRKDINNTEVDLGFADGALRGAVFVLPDDLEVEATVTAGEEGDPHGTMAQADFEIEVAATVEFEVEAPAGAGPEQVVALAVKLLSDSKAEARVAFKDGCLGSVLRLADPIKVVIAGR